MFNVSDDDLEGMESRARGVRDPGGMGMAPPPFGDDGGGGMPGPPPPAPSFSDPGPMTAAPAPLPPLPAGGGAASGAGKALLYVTGGLVVGAIAGGVWGAAAGVVGVGAARNMARVKALWNSPVDAERSEAGKSATMAIFGVGIASMLAYQAYKAKNKESFLP